MTEFRKGWFKTMTWNEKLRLDTEFEILMLEFYEELGIDKNE